MKGKFSSIMKTDGVRKNSAPLYDYRKAEAAGLSFLSIHIKKSQNVNIPRNKGRC